ncbi:PIN domain nuclease [Sphingomonas qilianensis]|uniref:PIN domain nuclease n=1 Tax=Sphingomonas qilianensis TaxID=1736690 RepID=A0ABU9XNB6_9SPHN
MILVDSSVWIDFFRDKDTPQTDLLIQVIRSNRLATGDLILAEVLQGISDDRTFDRALFQLGAWPIVDIVGEAVAVQAARNYRALRGLGITVRKSIDTLIATRCIMDQHHLLYSDRDFDPFVAHLGLISAMDAA